MDGIKYIIIAAVLISCSNGESSKNNTSERKDVGSIAKTEENNFDEKQKNVELVQEPDTSKIYGVVESNGFTYYREFYSEQEETDIGKEYLRIVKENEILWSYELPRLAKVDGNKKNILITDIESNKIILFSIENGALIYQFDFTDGILITDGTDVLLSSQNIYLTINNNDNEVTAVRSILLSDYSQKTIELEKEGYYSLFKDVSSLKVGIYETNNPTSLILTLEK